jgi:hypothetical protein
MPNGSLRPIYSLDAHAVSTGKPPFARPELHPDGSLRFADSRNRNFTAIWRSPFDAAAGNWTTWSVIANVSNAAPNPPRHGGGQGQTHPLMDVDLPATGPFAEHADGGARVAKKLVLTLDANNNQNYSRFHLGSAEWNPNAASGAHALRPSAWKWTAMPGGAWNATSCNVTMDTVGTRRAAPQHLEAITVHSQRPCLPAAHALSVPCAELIRRMQTALLEFNFFCHLNT